MSDVDTSIGRIEETFPSDFIPDIHVMMSEKQVDNEMKFKKHAVSYHILDNQYITVKVIDYRGRSKESFKWRTPYSEGNRGWWDIFYNLYVKLCEELGVTPANK